MNILKLIIKKKFFDMILSGVKKEIIPNIIISCDIFFVSLRNEENFVRE